MGLTDLLLNAHGGNATSVLAQKFGISPEQAASAVSALAPALASGLQQNASSQGGLESLLGALLSGNHQQYVEEPTTLDDPATVDDGNAILGHVLGSKDASRQVANQASAQTGLGADLLKKMLPVVAAMAMGAMSRRTNSLGLPNQPAGMGGGGGMLGTLGSLLGGAGSAGPSGGGGLLDVLGKLMG